MSEELCTAVMVLVGSNAVCGKGSTNQAQSESKAINQKAKFDLAGRGKSIGLLLKRQARDSSRRSRMSIVILRCGHWVAEKKPTYYLTISSLLTSH